LSLRFWPCVRGGRVLNRPTYSMQGRNLKRLHRVHLAIVSIVISRRLVSLNSVEK
jgi:hypothetical protein